MQAAFAHFKATIGHCALNLQFQVFYRKRLQEKDAVQCGCRAGRAARTGRGTRHLQVAGAGEDDTHANDVVSDESTQRTNGRRAKDITESGWHAALDEGVRWPAPSEGVAVVGQGH